MTSELSPKEFQLRVEHLMRQGFLFGTAVIIARYETRPPGEMPKHAVAWKVNRRNPPQLSK